ncbi:MAG: hypothetical protein FWD52_08945 [Candidatus Bathyarchaeota archaeon]|nr:hypothetical protein [Candidatus Termiticorpusculum sp.]
MAQFNRGITVDVWMYISFFLGYKADFYTFVVYNNNGGYSDWMQVMSTVL